MPARIDIFNQAIAALPASAISSVDETSLEARECRRFYPGVVSRMLEGPHDWSFAIKREVLALLTNDREREWSYAYAAPADMGTPIRLIPDFEAAGFALPVPLNGEPYAETWGNTGLEFAYLLDRGTIYTNLQSARLEYGVNAIEEAVLPAMAVDAIVKELAARIAVPVKKDRKLAQELAVEAEIAWQRAIADDANRQPTYGPDFVSQSMLARRGAGPWPIG